tara:strand:- start:1290 stop:1538 length:249 start_codon:yes stop_codon:yes gene_type:complete
MGPMTIAATRHHVRKIIAGLIEGKAFYLNDKRNNYPTLVEDTPGEWLAVWDSSNNPDKRRTAIRFGRLKILKHTSGISARSG